MKRISSYCFIAVILILSNILSCRDQGDIDQLALKTPAHQFKNYSFDPESSLISRTTRTPSFVLKYLRKLDKRDDYTDYMPNSAEMKLIKQYLNKLPDLNKTVSKERLLGIYFINNFLGSGLTEWVIDKNGSMYAFMVFNPETLKYNISRWLTYRENSCFIKDNKDITILIDCGKRFNGFMYVLLHESTHVVDYVKNITPYVEESLKKIGKYRENNTIFTEGIWKEIDKPENDYDFPYRESITFYGFNKGPRINISDSIKAYRELSKTPFVSLYGSMSWAEDIAEFIFFYHFTQNLKQPYKINVYKKKRLIYTLEPMKSPLVKKRISSINKFYK